MSRSDYAHWNEEADQVWWQEEGKHAESDAENARFEAEDEETTEDGYIREERD